MPKDKAAQPSAEPTPQPVEAVSIVVSALNALMETAPADAVDGSLRSLYQAAVQLAQKQADAIERIAVFEFASDELQGPAHAAIHEMRKIAKDARGA